MKWLDRARVQRWNGGANGVGKAWYEQRGHKRLTLGAARHCSTETNSAFQSSSFTAELTGVLVGSLAREREGESADRY